MKFINYITSKLFPTAPVNTDRPPTGSIYEWRSVDSGGNLIINYRMTTGPDKTFSINDSYTLPTASATVPGAIKVGNNLSISNGILSATMPVASQSVFGAIKVGDNLVINNGILSSVSDYALGKATTSTLGGVIVGSNISVDGNGVISVAQGAGYNLPTATNLIKGGVKIGANVSVTGDGTISVAAPYSLPTASATILGGVKIGNNLVITNGVLSATWPTPYTLPAATNSTLGGVIIGSGINLLNGTISVSPYTLPAATTGTRGGVTVGANISVDVNGVISVAAPYSLPTASALVLGGVKQGAGCVIDGNGVINITAINVVVHAAAEKLSIADADELPLMDSAATYALKKVSWTTIKATLWNWLYNTFVIAPKPTFLSKSGHNYQSMLIDGKLYTTTGYWTGAEAACSGRGLNGQNPYWGVNEFKRVEFPSSLNVIQTGGGGHTLAYALLSDGSLYTWGQNHYGSCGLGANVSPVGFPTLSLTGVQTVYSHPSMGGYHLDYNRLFVKKTNGTIWACGAGDQGALGNGSIVLTNSYWTQITSLGTNNVAKLFNLGNDYGCTIVLKSNGTIWGCGSNRQRYLGYGTANVVVSSFVDITSLWTGLTSTPGTLVAASLSVDANATRPASPLSLGVLETGWYRLTYTGGWSNIFTSGTNQFNRLSGDNGIIRIGTVALNVAAPGTNSTGYATSAEATAASIGMYVDVWCSGTDNILMWMNDTDYNNTGVTTFSLTKLVSPVVNDLKVSGVFGAGYGSLLMLITLSDGSKLVRACGYNGYGQLGNGNTTDQASPVTVLNSDNTVIDIATFGSNQYTTCQMLKSNQAVYAWGYNDYGQVGDGTTTARSTPAVVGTSVIKLLSDGQTCHYSGHLSQSFMITTDGRLWACGYNMDGTYCATGSTANSITWFNPVLMPYDEVVIDLGHFNTNDNGRVFLALTAKGNVYAWGYNGVYGLARHTDCNGYTPVPIIMPSLNQ